MLVRSCAQPTLYMDKMTINLSFAQVNEMVVHAQLNSVNQGNWGSSDQRGGDFSLRKNKNWSNAQLDQAHWW